MQLKVVLSNAKEYTCLVRESARAKRIILKRSRVNELILVIPKKRQISVDFLSHILIKNEKWILKTEKEEISPPTELNLQAIDEKWRVVYLAKGDMKVSSRLINEEGCGYSRCLEIFSASSLEEISKAINYHLVDCAKKFLEKRLVYCEEWYGLKRNYNEELKIILARGRWGAYRKRKSISLNARLLFLPLALVDYILLHELCHTIHLNHSKNFYALLAEKMPDYKRREKEIKNIDIPPIIWL